MLPGTLLICDYDLYIVAQVDQKHAALICLSNGNRWDEPPLEMAYPPDVHQNHAIYDFPEYEQWCLAEGDLPLFDGGVNNINKTTKCIPRES